MLIVAELLIAIAHLGGFALQVVAPASVVLLAVLLAVVGRAVRRGQRVPCMCFGSDKEEIASIATVIRLGGLMLAEATIAFWAASGSRPTPLYALGFSGALLAMLAASSWLTVFGWLVATYELIGLYRDIGHKKGCLRTRQERSIQAGD